VVGDFLQIGERLTITHCQNLYHHGQIFAIARSKDLMRAARCHLRTLLHHGLLEV
jgi:hypothetical protein